MTIESNAIEVLKQVVKKRNWYQGRISRYLANESKRNLMKGKLSYQNACDLLKISGWEKVKEETWEKGE